MRVFAYCAKSFERQTRRAAGVTKPITCPPVSSETLDVSALEGNDLLWFDLHGGPNVGFWYGDNGIIALTAEQVRSVDLTDTIVFALNCYLADRESPMLDALLDAGAKYVIGGDGENWEGVRSLYGAGLLGMWFRRLLQIGIPALKALPLARKRVQGTLLKDKLLGKKRKVDAAKDTLGFKAYYRRAI